MKDKDNKIICKYCGKPLIKKELYGRMFYIYSCDCIDKQERLRKISEIISKANFNQEDIDKIFQKHIIKFDKNLVVSSVKKYLYDISKFYSSRIGLFLFGAPGVRKTLSLIYLTIEIVKKYLTPVKFVSLDDLTSSFYDFDKYNYKKYKNIPILIIDDIRPQKWDMFDIIDYRVNNYKLTFLSSNYSYDEINSYLGPSVMSRIKSKLIIDNIEEKKDQRVLVF